MYTLKEDTEENAFHYRHRQFRYILYWAVLRNGDEDTSNIAL